MDVSQEKLKRDFVKASILLHETQFFVQTSNFLRENKEKPAEKLLAEYTCLKYNFVALKNLHDSKVDFNIYGKENEELLSLSKALNPYLEFATHVRNVIGGHLDNGVIDNAVQWEPFVFFGDGKEKTLERLFVMYRTLFESAINSYVDSSGVQKQFGVELDLNIPTYSEKLYNYMNGANDAAFVYLNKLKEYLNGLIRYDQNWEDLLQSTQKAAATDFADFKNKR